MNLASLVSGGKDSIYAAYIMQKQGHRIKYLLSMRPERTDSYMFHHPNTHLVEVQAKLMNIPLIIGKTRGEKEKELKDLEELLLKVKGKVDGIVTGALYSNYQKERIDALAKKLGLGSEAPLWHIDLLNYWDLLLENKFEIIITAVAAEGLDETWLGRKMDKEAVEDLKKLSKRYGINLAGEGGCFETLVLDCPIFNKKIRIEESQKIFEGLSGYLNITKVKLLPKDVV